MLRCSEVTRHSSDYIDGELPLMLQLQVRLHLMACRHCRRFVRQMRATVALLGHESESEETVDDDLISAYRTKSKPTIAGRCSHGSER
ncbi:MAG: zf-HC2 domain-containing protein [Hyphomicrobiales bacterium]|nr:zf-HC2 domain-containing protein [Hyphomicrobiales bacterium]